MSIGDFSLRCQICCTRAGRLSLMLFTVRLPLWRGRHCSRLARQRPRCSRLARQRPRCLVPVRANMLTPRGKRPGTGAVVDVDTLPEPRRVRSGDVIFRYSRGPWSPVQVTQDDYMSLAYGVDIRDAVLDALAMYFLIEELPVTHSKECLVFGSLFYRMLCLGGPSKVATMTRPVNVFEYSTWVFFLCEEGHWWTGVHSDVPRLERALSLSAGGAVHTGTPVATLAFLTHSVVIRGAHVCALGFSVGCGPRSCSEGCVRARRGSQPATG